LGNNAEKICQEWELFKERKLTVEDFRALSANLTEFLTTTRTQTTDLHNKMNDVLMAQEFQDLTGQIIRKVITLVQDLEDKLVELVRITGGQPTQLEKQHDVGTLEGPVVPGLDQGDVVNSQDEVDDLLSSLGF
jgi:chemotaxis protein CheZ